MLTGTKQLERTFRAKVPSTGSWKTPFLSSVVVEKKVDKLNVGNSSKLDSPFCLLSTLRSLSDGISACTRTSRVLQKRVFQLTYRHNRAVLETDVTLTRPASHSTGCAAWPKRCFFGVRSNYESQGPFHQYDCDVRLCAHAAPYLLVTLCLVCLGRKRSKLESCVTFAFIFFRFYRKLTFNRFS